MNKKTTSGAKNRRPLKLTQAEIAALLGVTRTHLSLVRHGHRQSRRLTRKYEELMGPI